MNERKIVGIIGNAKVPRDSKKWNIAFEIGKLLIDHGYRVANGGMGGVMEASILGAKSSENYIEGMTLTLIPTYQKSEGIAEGDIKIPTGMGLARNLLLTSMSDALIAIGGGSGTLSEIAFAWQMKKLIIGVDVEGWSSKLAGQQIDQRRNDTIFSAETAEEAVRLVDLEIARYTDEFKGVGQPSIDKTDAKKIITENFDVIEELHFLGKGKEGLVFGDNQTIYKLFKKIRPLSLFWKLSSLEETISKAKIKYLFPFELNYIDNYLILSYSKFDFSDYKGGMTKDLIGLAKELKRLNWLHTDIQPKNLKVHNNTRQLVIVDIGHSFEYYSEQLFDKMLRRMFVCSLIGEKGDEIKPALTETNMSTSFEQLETYGLNPSQVQEGFMHFSTKVKRLNKKELLNPVITQLIQQHEIQSVFDYGSGYGDIANDIKELGKEITAFEPDFDVYKKYKDIYYKGINFVKQEDLNEFIEEQNKFDCVILSLVLCHPLSKDYEERQQVIKTIMRNIVQLSNQFILIVICNPLSSLKKQSKLQTRKWEGEFNYNSEIELTKMIHSSQNERIDFHRPMSYYENLFISYNLQIIDIEQTNSSDPFQTTVESDFIVFLLEKSR